MKLSIARGVFLVCALLASGAAAPAARGDTLSGTLEFEFTGDDQIFDFGTFSDCETVSDEVDGVPIVVTLCINLDIAPDAKGNYEGTGDLVFSQDIEGTLTGPAKGKLRGKDASPGVPDPDDKASFKLKTEGVLSIGGGPFSIPTKVQLSCKGKIIAGIYDTLCDVKVKLEGYGSASEKNISVLDHADGGDWSCTINNLNLEDGKYSGVAIDSLGYSYVVSGKYDDSHDESSLTLKGLSDGHSNGAKIAFDDLVSDGPGTAAGEAKYKVQGYKGNADVSTD
jgi:hypothetical protein